MTRQECETKLMALAEQMHDVYKEFSPLSDILSVTISENGYISIFDGFFRGDQLINDVHDRAFQTVNVTKYSDGKIRHGYTSSGCAS